MGKWDQIPSVQSVVLFNLTKNENVIAEAHDSMDRYDMRKLYAIVNGAQ